MSTSSSADSRPPRLRRFRVDVSTIILLVVVVQSLLLLGLGYWGAQRLVSAVGESAHRADHLRVEDKVNSFLGKAMSVVEAVAASTGVRTGDGQGADSAELLWVLLQQSPELDSLYVATDAGRMVMAQRYPEPAVRHVVRERGTTVETWEYKGPTSLRTDAQNSLVTRHTGEHATHNDPRSRAWFQAVARQGRPAWTAPYLFALAQEPGVSYAIPAWGEDGDASRGDGPGEGAGNGRSTGRAIGTAAGSGTRMRVASGDVTLGRLSDFVSQFSRAGYGDSALLSADRHVLARSDLPGRLQRLAPPSDGLLGAIHARMLDDGSAHDTASLHFPLTHEGARYLVRASHIATTGWQLVSWVSEDQLMGGLRRAVLVSLLGVMAFLGAVLWLALRLAQRVTAPVEQLAHIARRIGRLELDGLPRVNSRVLEMQHLDQALDDSARGLKAFRRFVPVGVVQQLLAEGRPLEPSGEPREITVMFSDIHGFTALAESIPPAVLVAQLTQYFNAASDVISGHGGTIDKFIGDGIMVLWGAPTELHDAAFKASQAALALLQAIDALNTQWAAQGLEAFDTCIGIHTGPVVAGVLGANDRLAYTAIGDTVNVASRIEGINRELGTRVLVSDTTAQALAGRLTTRRIDTVELRGRQRPLMVYELLPAPPEAPPEALAPAALSGK